MYAMSGISTVWAEQPTPINVANLPKPPSAIRDLIGSGRVTFEAGHREESGAPSDGPRLAAETRFQIEFKYSSRSRWTVARDNRRVVINVRFLSITWKPKHTVWFRRRPATEDFWTNDLVLHELDHVRISNDPRLAARFAESLREQRVLVHIISPRDVVNQSFVDRLVGEHVERVFAGITDLISIRYQELDRITKHGRRPIPNDSPLQELLRPDPAVSP
jgi:hypothetical protein